MQYKKIYLEITNNCNLNCDFCIKNKRKQQFITINEFNTVLDKIKPYTNYLYFHILGEPLMHPKINELISNAKEKEFNVNITTNGYLIKRIKDNKNIRQVNISLHSFNDKYNISLDNYLNDIFNTIDTLIENKTYISLRLWVKNKYNNEIITKINEHYNTNIKENIDNFKINNYLFINNFHEFIWPDINNSYYNENGRCNGLIDHFGILSTGEIIPCCLDSKGIINLGNIYQDNLEDVFNSKLVKEMREGFLNNKKCQELCRHCSFLGGSNESNRLEK